MNSNYPPTMTPSPLSLTVLLFSTPSGEGDYHLPTTKSQISDLLSPTSSTSLPLIQLALSIQLTNWFYFSKYLARKVSDGSHMKLSTLWTLDILRAQEDRLALPFAPVREHLRQMCLSLSLLIPYWTVLISI
jgi:hypothetical protein